MNIVDFFPKYPDIKANKYPNLNTYEEDFNSVLYHKKEFYENRLEKEEVFPSEKGSLTKYQKTIARFLSVHTLYNKLLLVHAVGTGKTCSAIGAIEQIKSESSNYTGAMIFAKGSNLLDNFSKELIEKCTLGQYYPENYKKLTVLERQIRTKKMIKFYSFNTFAKFAKEIKRYTDEQIVDQYSNRIIVIDEVHNLRIQEKSEDLEEDVIESYNQFHRFLHLINNSKILLLSATPMKDNVKEIASITNLLLPLDKQFPVEDEFLEEYTYTKDDVVYIKEEKKQKIKDKLKGLISFLKEDTSDIEKIYIGEEKFGGLKHLIVNPLNMSDFQSLNYIKAYGKDKNGKAGVYINSREATLFIYPDGSYGKEGFQKYIVNEKKMDVQTYKLSKELRDALQGKTEKETLAKIKQHSAIYGNVIEKILDTDGNCFVYSSLAKGSGAILFSLLLTLFGFSRAKGSEKNIGLRYAILTNATASSNSIKKIRTRFNSKDNAHGDIIKVIIGSKAVSEGFSFSNVLLECINTPHWNYSETIQALGRGIRVNSHRNLIEEGRKPIVSILQPVSIPKKGAEYSIDLLMYKTSEDKDISIRGVLRLLMECAFDCALNYMRNHIKGKKGSRECDYMACNYTCEGVDMQEVKEGIPEEKLDISTYELFYATPRIPQIKITLEKLFREYGEIDIDTIKNNMKNEFTEEEIENTLFLLEEESKNHDYTYEQFKKYHFNSPIKKIESRIEILFKQVFSITFEKLASFLEGYTLFEILTCLHYLISNNVIIYNKYGFPSYIREDKNVYFLVNTIGIDPDFFTEYYTKNPYIKFRNENVIESMDRGSLEYRIVFLSEDIRDEDFMEGMKILPLDVQEMLIEYSIIAKIKNVQQGSVFRERVLKYFKNYIKNVNSVWVSTLLKNSKKVYRCLEDEEWQNCTKDYGKIFVEEEGKRHEKVEKNPYGIYGKYNPENNTFCIVDVTKNVKIEGDTRKVQTGKACSTGWKLPELIDIVCKRVKIETPADFKTESNEKIISNIISDEVANKVYTKEELEKLSTKELKIIAYWGLPKKLGGIRTINILCSTLQAWLESKGLLEIDNQCGVQGKKKTDKGEKTKLFNYIVLIPATQKERFKNYSKAISRIAQECLDIKKFSSSIEVGTFVLFLDKERIVGFITVNKENEIEYVAVNKTVRNKIYIKNVIERGLAYLYSYLKRDIPLVVDIRGKRYQSLLSIYQNFGFKISQTKNKKTYMYI